MTRIAIGLTRLANRGPGFLSAIQRLKSISRVQNFANPSPARHRAPPPRAAVKARREALVQMTGSNTAGRQCTPDHVSRLVLTPSETSPLLKSGLLIKDIPRATAIAKLATPAPI
jgi:hypothetical protein